MAPATRAFTYSEWTLEGGRRERAVAAAVADSEAGDIVLLEMQTTSTSTAPQTRSARSTTGFDVVSVRSGSRSTLPSPSSTSLRLINPPSQQLQMHGLRPLLPPRRRPAQLLLPVDPATQGKRRVGILARGQDHRGTYST